MGITIAIPYLSRNKESFFRDGLGKFLGLLVNGILQEEDEVKIEVWCYSQGVDSMKLLFEQYLKDGYNRITYIKDFDEYKKSGSYKRKCQQGILEDILRREYEGGEKKKSRILSKAVSLRTRIRQRYYLIKAIKNNSCADFVYYNSPCFFPLLSIRKPTLIQIHDLFTMQYEKIFVQNSKRYLLTNKEVACWLGIQGLQGAHFVSSSNNTINNQVLKYIPFILKEHAHMIRFPAMIKIFEGTEGMTKEEFCRKYGIKNAYISYPTQNRPNKNIITLLRAINHLRRKGIKVQLVITGRFDDVAVCKRYLSKNHSVKKMIVETGNLSEEELYMLYKYSDMVVSTSIVEGACISGQVLEALKIGRIPVICSLMDGVDEWLEVHGLDRKSADMNWFERYDYIKLAELIEDVLYNRKMHIIKQQHIFDNLKEPTWEETARKYMELISEILYKNKKCKEPM